MQTKDTEIFISDSNELNHTELVNLIRTNPEKVLQLPTIPLEIVNYEEQQTKQTPLHIAVQVKDKEIVVKLIDKLISNGAVIKKDMYGQSILFYLLKDGNDKAIDEHFILRGK